MLKGEILIQLTKMAASIWTLNMFIEMFREICRGKLEFKSMQNNVRKSVGYRKQNTRYALPATQSYMNISSNFTSFESYRYTYLVTILDSSNLLLLFINRGIKIYLKTKDRRKNRPQVNLFIN